MIDNAENFWERIKVLIKTQNTTQEWIANQCGVVVGTLKGQIFRKVFPDALQSVKIALALNTSVEYLITGKEPENLSIEERQLIDKYRALGEVDQEAARTLINILSGKKDLKKQTDTLVLTDHTPDYGTDTIDSIETELVDMGEIIMIPCFGLTAAGKPVDTYAVPDDYIPFPLKLLASAPEEYFFLRVRGLSMTEDGIDDGDLILLRRTNLPLNDRIMLVRYDNGTTIKRIRIDESGYCWLCWDDGSGRKMKVSTDQCQIQGALVWHGSENLKNRI